MERVTLTPGMPEACIQASQQVYDERAQSGLFSAGELRVAKAALEAFHTQMRDLMLRLKLCGLVKEILASKKMERRPEVEMGVIMDRMRRLEEIEDLWLQLPKVMQPEFEIVIGQVELELMVRMERFLVKTVGAEEARRAMGLKKGEESYSQLRQEGRRIRASRIRKPKDRK